MKINKTQVIRHIIGRLVQNLSFLFYNFYKYFKKKRCNNNAYNEITRRIF